MESIRVTMGFYATQEWRRRVLENQEVKRFVVEGVKKALEDLRSTLDYAKEMMKITEDALKDLKLL